MPYPTPATSSTEVKPSIGAPALGSPPGTGVWANTSLKQKNKVIMKNERMVFFIWPSVSIV